MQRIVLLLVACLLLAAALLGCSSPEVSDEPEAEVSPALALADEFILAVTEDDADAFDALFDQPHACTAVFDWVDSAASVEHVEANTRVALKNEAKALMTVEGFGRVVGKETVASIREEDSEQAVVLVESDADDILLHMEVVRGGWRVVGIEEWEPLLGDEFLDEWVAVLVAEAKQHAEDEAAADAARDAAQAKDDADREAAADEPPSDGTVSGLTLTERKQVAWELAELEDQAMVEAEMRFPTNLMTGGTQENVMPNAELWTELQEQYQAELCDEWGITYDEMLGIIVEALENDWPLPEPPDLGDL